MMEDPDKRRAIDKAELSFYQDTRKEELFQLEIERKLGHISEPEYNRAKAALDQTLERALRREAAKVN